MTVGPAQSRPAFTLIELMVVVALVALLLAILLPATGRARFLARTAVCASQFHQWGLATASYTFDGNGLLPSFESPAIGGSNTWDAANEFRPAMVARGVSWKLWFCPLSAQDGWNTTTFWGSPYADPTTEQRAWAMLNAFTPDRLLMRLNWWVPRIGAQGLFPTAQAGGPEFPSGISSAAAGVRPILSDHLGSTPTSVSNLDSAGVYGGHRWNGRIESVNLLFIDGHVTPHPANQIQNVYHGNYGNFY